jgi:hypothetical protein
MLAPSPEPDSPDSAYVVEVTTAANYLTGHLLSHVSPTVVSLFRGNLLRALSAKCAASWDPTKPEKGSAFRSVSFMNGKADSLVEGAAKEAGIRGGVGALYPSELV